jgi:hypothetical protein
MTDSTRRALLWAMAATGCGLGGAVLGGCASTPAANGAPPKGRHYTETISSVLVSADHQHLVAIGRDHHYVFDAPELLVRALQSPLHGWLSAAFTPFHVDAQGAVTGDVMLRLPRDATAAQQEAAGALGLQRQADGDWEALVHMHGQRFSSWTYKWPDQTREKLNQRYTVEFTTDEGLKDAVVDKAVTPVRVAADGVNLIYYAALAPIIIPFVFLTKARDH